MHNAPYSNKKPHWMPLITMTVILLLNSLLYAQEQTTATDEISKVESTHAPSRLLIEQLSNSADVVAIAQVALTSYDYRRGFPVSGYAVLEVIIPYKTDKPLRRIRVSEEGFGEDLCYFPPTAPGQEGARYLVFLAEHEDGDYRGHPVRCSLQVLVTDKHAYALRVPLLEPLTLTEEQAEWVEPMTFNDPFAITGSAELTQGRKEQLANNVEGIVVEKGVKYTQGIAINYFRHLIGATNLRKPPSGGKY